MAASTLLIHQCPSSQLPRPASQFSVPASLQRDRAATCSYTTGTAFLAHTIPKPLPDVRHRRMALPRWALLATGLPINNLLQRIMPCSSLNPHCLCASLQPAEAGSCEGGSSGRSNAAARLWPLQQQAGRARAPKTRWIGDCVRARAWRNVWKSSIAKASFGRGLARCDCA